MTSELDVVRQYEYLILLREPLSSARSNHIVNWGDAPSKYSIYIDCSRVPLHGDMNEIQSMHNNYSSPIDSVNIKQVSDFLLLSYGLLRRKLTINWSTSGSHSLENEKSVYKRPPASAGGLYPFDIYFVASNDINFPAGVYHYDVAHHALTRVRMGNFETLMKSVINYSETETADAYFILVLRFWRNTFKYHNFGYQLAAQDAGALLGSMEEISFALGWNSTIVYWFQDRLLATLLGLDIDQAAPWALFAAKSSNPGRRGESKLQNTQSVCSAALRPIHKDLHERSSTVSIPELAVQIHRKTLLTDPVRPKSGALQRLIDQSPRRATTLMLDDPCSLVQARETSAGRFRREPNLEIAKLKQILAHSFNGFQYKADIYGCETALPSLRVSLIAKHIDDLPEGVYDYFARTHHICIQSSRPLMEPLQSLYVLLNYNLDQIAAMLVVISQFEEMLGIFGPRAIRLINAEAGILAQRAYIASTSLGVGCAVVAGFDRQRIIRIIGLDHKSEIPLLLIFLGHQVPSAAYDFRLY